MLDPHPTALRARRASALACPLACLALAAATCLPGLARAEEPAAEKPGAAEPAAEEEVAAGPRRHALVVGVGAYPPSSRWPALAGATADAREVARTLVSELGFAERDVRLLLDAEATRAAILAGLDELLAGAGRGDMLLFYFAGHGSRLPDQEGEGADEADGWDETLVPYDAEGGPERGWRDIRDDDVAAWIARANALTEQVVLVFDCCSSGTAARSVGLVPRYLEPKARGIEAPAARGFGGLRLSTPGERLSGWVPPTLRYVALSACRAGQSAFELALEDEEGVPRPRGLFTHALLESLRAGGRDASYAELAARVEARVRARVEDQTPLVEGPLYAYRAFGHELGLRAPRFALERDARGLYWIEGGALEGLNEGDVLALVRAEAAHDTQERLGRVALERLGARSSARWLGEAPEPPPGRYAGLLIERGATGVRLPLCLVGAAPEREALARRLERSGLLALVEARDARYMLALEPGRPHEPSASPRWSLATQDGRALPLGARSGDEHALERLCDELERLALAWRTARALCAPAAGGPELTAELLRVSEGVLGGAPPLAEEGRADAPYALVPAERVTLRLQNLSDGELFVTALAVLPDAEVALVWRTEPDEPLHPGEERLAPAFWLEAPPGLEPFWDAGEAELLVVATRTPRDLTHLWQPPLAPPEPLLATRGVGREDRPKRSPEPAFAPEEAWSTTRLRIVLRR